MSNYFVHPTSLVEDSQIGAGTKIWHFCHIHGAKIGRNCVIGQNCYIAPGVVIGDGVHIQNNVSVYSGVTLEDDVFVGPSAVFTNMLNPRAFISRKSEYKPTLVKKGASLGANCTIVCGVNIGEYAVVGAGSVVTRSVQPLTLVHGNPARYKYNVDKDFSR